MKTHKLHLYKNIFLLAVGIGISLWLAQFAPFRSFLLHLDGYGYIGAFLAGVLFCSSFTFSLGAVALAILAKSLPPIGLAIVAGLGGVLGDFIIFHLIRDDVMEDIRPLYKKLGGNHLTTI